MKNPASVREEKKENNNTINHGESNLKRYSLWFIVFTGLTFLFGASGASAYDEVERLTLDNGMVVLLEEKPKQELVNLFLCVRVGSGREGKYSGSGISHFIEHMTFKGTAKRATGDIFKEIESYGGKINAFTSYDYSGYNITVPGDFAPLALELLADMTLRPTFDKQELEKEKQVVLREIRLNYDDPQRYSSRLLWQSAYSTHPYKYPILGEEDLFKKLSRRDLVEFHQAAYTPDNMILAVVGGIEKESFLALTEKTFKPFKQKYVMDLGVSREPQQTQLRKHEEKFTSGMSYLLFAFHSVAITDEDCFALDALGTILGEGESSRLYKLICARKKLAYGIEAVNYTPRDPGLFIISAFLEERHREKAQSLIFEQIELLKKKEVSPDELESAKNKIISDILFHRQTVEAQAQDLALNEALCSNFRFTELYIQKIKQVSPQDIIRVANKYLIEDKLNIVALTPREDSPRALEPIKKYVLGPGIRLLIKEDSQLPLVSMKAVFKGGLRAESEETNGLCNLTAQMLDKGTRGKNAAEIAHLVESKGARLSYFSGNNSFGLSLDSLSQDWGQMLTLLSELIADSTFPRREFRREKEKNLAGLLAQEDDIFESGNRLLKTTLFQTHPYRFVTLGNEKSLKKLTHRDLITFYRNFCRGKNMVLAVFGDVKAEEVLAKAEEVFGRLKPGEAPIIVTPKEPRTERLRTAVKSLPKQQSLVLMGFYGSNLFSRDRYVLETICQVLSQASGRLFTQIREKKGLAYTLGAYSVSGLDPGYIVIYVATLPENTETVKKEILNQLNLLKEKPLSGEELLQAKRALLGRKLIARQTNSACAMESALDELYGLGYDNYLNYSEQINLVEGRDIIRCARQYFDFNNYATVLIGP
ncbi:MAG: insulinase family protein [Candidatus Omnitrophota bacterium]|nr:MAG: insulinase family protein [Candidatus Omnitrophota bacterium]